MNKGDRHAHAWNRISHNKTFWSFGTDFFSLAFHFWRNTVDFVGSISVDYFTSQ